jgi:all-trans-8'-apo-beta-carotenal 15,15'-oxygenase
VAKLSEALAGMETNSELQVEGKLPEGFPSGVLHRNGPGIFQRDGVPKGSMLDGDGMIRRTSIANGEARFSTRFVQTEKYVDEEQAGRFIYPTWTSRGGIPSRSQAGVAVVEKVVGGKRILVALDEVGLPYGLDPDTLKTMGEVNPSAGDASTADISFKAHTKTDGATGNWILPGLRGNMNPELHVLVMDPTGKKLRHVAHPSPRGRAYFHDIWHTDKYAVFHLQPMLLPDFPLAMLLGARSYAESLEWKPKEGGLLCIVDTTGVEPPVNIEVPACFMWHTVNAHYNKDSKTIVADFVGYDAPDHFLGKDAALSVIMQEWRMHLAPCGASLSIWRQKKQNWKQLLKAATNFRVLRRGWLDRIINTAGWHLTVQIKEY